MNQTERKTLNTKESLKSENKKAGGKFAVMIIISAVIGGFVGFFSVMGREGILGILHGIRAWIADYSDILSVVTAASMLLLLVIVAGHQRKSLRNVKTDKLINANVMEENAIEKAEQDLNRCLSISNLSFYLLFAIFTLSCYLFFGMRDEFSSMERSSFIMLAVGLFLSALFLISGGIILTRQQQKVVDILRILNPEKRGSVYEFNFNKKWEESCDERERIQIYYCGYKAFNAVRILCLIFWGVGIIAGIGFGVGYSLAAVMTIILIVTNAVYAYHSNGK